VPAARENFRQPLDADRDATALLADLLVLAEYAAQIAMRKKYGARPVCPDEARLFPRMQRHQRDLGQFSRLTKSALTKPAVYTAAPRTEFTFFQFHLYRFPTSLYSAPCERQHNGPSF